jgi:hypothetical protein
MGLKEKKKNYKNCELGEAVGMKFYIPNPNNDCEVHYIFEMFHIQLFVGFMIFPIPSLQTLSS